MDARAGELAVGLLHIGMFGNLDRIAADRSKRTALIATAQKRGLVVWSRLRRCYQLTPVGYRIAANCDPQCSITFRRRLSAQVIIVAALASASTAIGTAYMTTEREPQLKRVVSVQPLAATVAVAAPEAAIVASNDAEHQPAPTLSANNMQELVEENVVRRPDSTSIPNEQKPGKVASKHHDKPRKTARERRRDKGPGFASTGYANSYFRAREAINSGGP